MGVKFEGMELAVKQFNGYQGIAVIFVDFDDNTAWCDLLDIPTYHSDSIVGIVSKDDLYGRNDKYRPDDVTWLAVKAKKLLDEGYEAWQLEYVMSEAYAEVSR